MLFFITTLLSLSFASCEYPFPLHLEDKVVSACLKSEKFQVIGHMTFVQIPRAVYSDDHSSKITYFENSAETRQRLCQILGVKRQSREYALQDKRGRTVSYSRDGFEIKEKANTLKMLACTKF